MSKHHLMLLTFTVMLSAFFAFGWVTLPAPEKANHEGFSSARVVEDLKVIAQEPHSVAHPEARAKVADYLKKRLEALGGNTQTFHYPNIEAKKFKFDVTNVLAEFPPLSPSTDATYLMLVAHYDSRYPWKVINDTVLSKGAADDGYGLGVILECVKQTLKYRSEWKQGIKVLFTDAEEVGMQGMEAAYTHHKELFDNVGLLINFEARGTYGPVLLFETSPGNERLMEMYKTQAKYPYTYSLTNVVYQSMPNGTDFSIVKDSIPGFNFSSIADINHYHTDKDNIDNISEKTIQHYGEQVLPILRHYLTSPEYADKEYLKAEKDAVFFTIPGLGLFLYPTNRYSMLCIGVLVLFVLVFRRDWQYGQCELPEVARLSGRLLLSSLSALIVGELIAWISALTVGAKFKWFGVITGIPFDNAAMLLSILALLAMALRWYLQNRNAYCLLYATLSIMALLSFILLIAIGENMMFIIPLAVSGVGLMLWHTTRLKVFLLISIAVILLHAFSFLFVLAMALTIGAIGLILLIAFFDIMLLIALGDLYLTDRVSNRIP